MKTYHLCDCKKHDAIAYFGNEHLCAECIQKKADEYRALIARVEELEAENERLKQEKQGLEAEVARMASFLGWD